MRTPRILISFPFVEEGGAWHIPLGAACVDALLDMGFEVDTFNPVVGEKKGAGWKAMERCAVLGGRLVGRSKASTKARLPWLEEARRAKALLEKVRQSHPDILLVISTFTYPASLLEQLRSECGVKEIIGWCVEGPTWAQNPNTEADLYDHYFCIHRSGIINNTIRHLPAVGLDVSAYSKLAGIPKRRDLVFVGRQKPRRIEWLKEMESLDLEIYGPAWRSTALANRCLSDGIFGDALNHLYNESRIVLNVSAWSNHDLNCLNLRILDVPATGSVLLTDSAPDIAEYLAPGREVLVADSPEEMRDKARWYLAHDSEREAIAAAGYARVQQLETYPQKIRRLLDMCKIAIPNS